MTALDNRLNVFRPNLADARLRGRVEAEAFSDGLLMQVAAPIVPVHREPRADAMQLTQALLGETLRVFDMADGWAWVQLTADRYVGYVTASALSDEVTAPTHRVAVPSTLIYPKPNLKSQPAVPVTMNARVTVTGTEGAFAWLANDRFIYSAHLKPLSDNETDFTAVAGMFRHAPYYWGGKSVHGLDCSGLVQLALEACGQSCPRDSDMQESLGQPLLVNDLDTLARGDMVFWKGHVGIMTGSETLLHANGHHMMVVAEPLRDAIARIGATGSGVTHIRRL